jgi:hypothetical protein
MVHPKNIIPAKRPQYALFLVFIILLAVLNVFQQGINIGEIKQALLSASNIAASISTSTLTPLQLSKIDSEEEEYLEWLLVERKKSLNLTEEEQPLIVHYRAMAGLGHQLLRMSSAYHLAMLYKIPRIWPTENPVCGGTIFTIFSYLIGEGQIIVDVPFLKPNNLFEQPIPFPKSFPNLTFANQAHLSPDKRQALIRKISMNNEVAGYGHPANPQGIWDRYGLELILQNQFYSKDLTDYQLYHQLMLLFEHKHKKRIQTVMNHTRFNEHTVFALHIRTGNGEVGEFRLKKRNIQNLEKWMVNVMQQLCDYRSHHSHYFTTAKPLMIYVGTDTGSVIPKLQNISSQHCQIPIVSADQAYPEMGKSVSFKYKYNDNESCLKGWENMFLDMYMFTRCNSVVTGTYSSFTQAAPMSFVMHKAKWNSYHPATHPHSFCQLGPHGNRIDCYDNLKDWLERKPHVTWGDDQAPNQEMRHELTFPSYNTGRASELTELFQGTVLTMQEG